MGITEKLFLFCNCRTSCSITAPAVFILVSLYINVTFEHLIVWYPVWLFKLLTLLHCWLNICELFNKSEWTILKAAFLVFVLAVATNEFARDTIFLLHNQSVQWLQWWQLNSGCIICVLAAGIPAVEVPWVRPMCGQWWQQCLIAMYCLWDYIHSSGEYHLLFLLCGVHLWHKCNRFSFIRYLAAVAWWQKWLQACVTHSHTQPQLLGIWVDIHISAAIENRRSLKVLHFQTQSNFISTNPSYEVRNIYIKLCT